MKNLDNTPKRRGRPKGSTNKTTQTRTVVSTNSIRSVLVLCGTAELGRLIQLLADNGFTQFSVT